MIYIKEVKENNIKSHITNNILPLLPEWFGIESSIKSYVENVKDQIFYCAYEDNKPIGFLSLKLHNEYTADIYVTGILKEYHRQGIGKQLVIKAEEYLKSHHYKFFMVKTLGESSDYEYYKRTRLFYLSMGFYPLEEIKEIWDEDNPCLIMVKSLV